ncbi:MAG: hypothetical protein MK324_15355, partial [Pirellulales bacterium]|nr:hypothetical protein [Pirellulales bacterium]
MDLTGSWGNDILDVSAFQGSTILKGLEGDDILKGGPFSDIIRGGLGNDKITGDAGNDELHGGAGIDKLVELNRDVSDIILTNTYLKSGTQNSDGSWSITSETDIIAGFEQAHLSGGNSANKMDASAFGGLNPSTLLNDFNNGTGIPMNTGSAVNLTSSTRTTPLRILNNGAGIRTSEGNDLQIVLNDAKTVSIDLSGAETLQELFATINQAIDAIPGIDPGRAVVGLNSSGTAIQLTDSGSGNNPLSIQPLGDSFATQDLGLSNREGTASFILGLPIAGTSSDIRITKSDKSYFEVNVVGALSISDVLNRISADPELTASMDSEGEITDENTSGQGGELQIADLGLSQVAKELGINKSGTGSIAGSPSL